MSAAKITLIGFSDWMEAHNDDLFKYLTVPSGIDKDILIHTILLNGGEFEVLYSNPVFMQEMIGKWSSKWQHTMKRWIDALNIDYNPLENYDRMEDWKDVNERNSSTSRKESATGKDNSLSSGNGKTLNDRSAFDANDYQPHDITESSSNGVNSSMSETTANGETEDNSNEILQKTGRAHGNIGVTTSQQMLQSELNLYKWNLYDEIANLFLNEFAIYVY